MTGRRASRGLQVRLPAKVLYEERLGLGRDRLARYFDFWLPCMHARPFRKAEMLGERMCFSWGCRHPGWFEKQCSRKTQSIGMTPFAFRGRYCRSPTPIEHHDLENSTQGWCTSTADRTMASKQKPQHSRSAGSETRFEGGSVKGTDTEGFEKGSLMRLATFDEDVRAVPLI